MKIIDSHQHFWDRTTPWFNWPTPDLTAIYRDFQPADLAPILSENGVVATVLVQAAPALEETRHLLDLAARESFVAGVVGWVDFSIPSLAADQIDDLARNPLFKGVRPMLQAIDAADWILNDSFSPVFDALLRNGLAFDALVQPRHLGVLLEMAERWPSVRIVIDHAAKPQIASAGFTDWCAGIEMLARKTNIWCKLSGLLTELPASSHADDCFLVINHLISNFSTERLIWGSDWPVVNLAASYSDWLSLSRSRLSALPPGVQNDIFYRNAITVYRLIIEENNP
ncbi:amidohydrolase family protein [Aquisalinus flavus]|uniref:Hydrolase n=1 Tax=Aquisalinus flavus TaxID=1526572 RepID=A0A8J2V4P8_9PROT|nr:amidohydrolase family protein [Aquisalinus flavus]MBD0426003.1 amidohydrolase family protein [Aquisalinus flavus]UNE48405.1 amidohydrolase family protein [Aquisalinus flavus]GGD11502.1 hydrolase [Aquisalinus flavus]